MAAFNFYMERLRPGQRQPGYVRASMRADAHAPDGKEIAAPSREAKEQLINFHISTINAILRAKGKPELSSADFARIHAAAEHSSATNSESIMEAVLGAANTALPNDAQATFKQQLAEKGIDEAAYYNAIAKFGASLGSFDAIVAAARGLRNGNMSGSGWDQNPSYSSAAVSNFSYSNGTLSGMTSQLYRVHFQAYYGTGPQGQFTATRVANILGNNEGLTGAALVRRTKEVGHDTRHRLGLDTNVYAPKVANIGKKYSDPAIAYKEMLDQAIELQKQGRQAEADEMSRRAEEHRKHQEERARREDPAKAPDVSSVYGGVDTNALKNGWKPRDVVATWDGLVDSNDPKARERLAELNKTLSTTPAGREAAERFKPIAEKAIQAAEERRKAEATNGVKVDDLDGLAALASNEPVKDKPIVKADAEPPKGQPVQEAKKEEPKKVAVATNGRAAGPV